MSETAAEPANVERVKMRHSVTGGETEVTREQFDVVYRDLGWEEVKDAPAPVAAAPRPARPEVAPAAPQA